MSTLRIEIREDASLTAAQRQAARELHAEAFPGSRFSLASTRMLVWDGNELVGQMGIENRVVGFGGNEIASTLGVVDLCVAQSARGRGIGSQMLEKLEELGRVEGADFVLLFALDVRVYERNGYTAPGNCELCLFDPDAVPTMMVKPLANRVWASGSVDLFAAAA